MGCSVCWHQPTPNQLPSCTQGMGASRHLIQTTLQAEVFRRNASKLTVREGSRVAGLAWSDDGGSVVGEA